MSINQQKQVTMRTVVVKCMIVLFCSFLSSCDFAKGVKEDAKRLEKNPLPDTVILKDSTKVILQTPEDSLSKEQ